MPLVGTRPVNAFDNGPLVTEIGAEPWLLPGCGILQIMYEIDADAMTSLLPPALHPTIPPTVVLTVQEDVGHHEAGDADEQFGERIELREEVPRPGKGQGRVVIEDEQHEATSVEVDQRFAA